MALEHGEFTSFTTKFGLYEYMEMPFELCNVPAPFEREINRILQPLLGITLVIDMKILVDKDGGMVVVAYIDDILIATKWSLEKHHRQVSKVFQLHMYQTMYIKINKRVFDATEITFLACAVSGSSLRMDPDIT
jgi:hypothetical protein